MTPRPPDLVPPGPGRRYPGRRTVRLGDVLPSGRARLDALAQYLQDIAADDGVDAGIDPHLGWVVRRTAMVIDRRPRMGERLELVTWASGTGQRWAERRTTIAAPDGTAMVEAASLWVCVDAATVRPARLSARFWERYGEAVGDRAVSARLTLADPAVELSARARPWPVRLSDLDTFGHVNNAVAWEAVEDEVDRMAPGAEVRWAELEYRAPIDRSSGVGVVGEAGGDGVLGVWLVGEGSALASARVGVDTGP